MGGAVLVSLKSPQWVQVPGGPILSFRPILWELLILRNFSHWKFNNVLKNQTFSKHQISLKHIYFVKVCYNTCSADTGHTSRVVVNIFGGYNLSFFGNVYFSSVNLTKFSYLWEKNWTNFLYHKIGKKKDTLIVIIGIPTKWSLAWSIEGIWELGLMMHKYVISHKSFSCSNRSYYHLDL